MTLGRGDVHDARRAVRPVAERGDWSAASGGGEEWGGVGASGSWGVAFLFIYLFIMFSSAQGSACFLNFCWFVFFFPLAEDRRRESALEGFFFFFNSFWMMLRSFVRGSTQTDGSHEEKM